MILGIKKVSDRHTTSILLKNEEEFLFLDKHIHQTRKNLSEQGFIQYENMKLNPNYSEAEGDDVMSVRVEYVRAGDLFELGQALERFRILNEEN